MPWIDYQLEAHVTFGKKWNLGTSFCYQNEFQLVQILKCKQNETIALEGGTFFITLELGVFLLRP